MLVPDTYDAEAWSIRSADNIGDAERWVSHLKLVVYSYGEFSESGTIEYSLTRISRAEPRADLFEAPADYEVTTAKYPLSWAGPKRMLELMEKATSRR